MRTAIPLADLLAEEIQQVGAFIELLRQEQALLASSGNADALLPLAEQKSESASRLRTLSDRRERFLAAHRLQPGREGMETYLAQASDAAAKPLWKELLSLAAEARALNETNGKLITIHWQHNQQALAALMSAADRAMTYGPDGQQSGTVTGGRRFLGSA